jgi:hypothetical protein
VVKLPTPEIASPKLIAVAPAGSGADVKLARFQKDVGGISGLDCQVTHVPDEFL